MELGKYTELKLEGGKLIVTADLKTLIIPVLEKIKAEVEAGVIDPVKGTDLDKIALEQVIEILEKQLG